MNTTGPASRSILHPAPRSAAIGSAVNSSRGKWKAAGSLLLKALLPKAPSTNLSSRLFISELVFAQRYSRASHFWLLTDRADELARAARTDSESWHGILVRCAGFRDVWPYRKRP